MFCSPEFLGLAIGHPLSEIEAKMSLEEMSYRMDLYKVTEQAVANRGVTGYFHYAFPEEVASEADADIPPQVKSKIQSKFYGLNSPLYHLN